MSSSWERVPITRMCATCAREFEHTPNPNGGRQPTRCPKCRGESAAPPKKKTPVVALVPSAPAPVSAHVLPGPPPSRGHLASAIEELEQQALLIADAIRALRALQESA